MAGEPKDEPAAGQPSTKPVKAWYTPTAHPAAASALLAGAVANLAIAFASPWCEAHGIDLKAHAGDLTIVAGALAGFWTK